MNKKPISSQDVFHADDCLRRYDRLHAVLRQIAARSDVPEEVQQLCLKTVEETYLTKHHEASSLYAVEFERLQADNKNLVAAKRDELTKERNACEHTRAQARAQKWTWHCFCGQHNET